MQVGPYRINCTVASLGYNHLSLLIFTKLALTYFASVVKSNFGNFGGVNPLRMPTLGCFTCLLYIDCLFDILKIAGIVNIYVVL